MIEAGYKLIKIDDETVVQTWGGTPGESPGIPNPLPLPGNLMVHAASLDTDYHGYKLTHWLMDEPAPTRAMVNAERDRRIDAGFPHAGKVIQFDQSSQSNILGACQMAVLATMAGGGQTGDYLWHGGDTPFEWITADNTTLTLDAPGVIALGQAGASFKSMMIFKARALKDMTPIPTDYNADSYWS